MRQAIFQQLAELESEAEAKPAKERRKVLRMTRVLEQEWDDRPRKREEVIGA